MSHSYALGSNSPILPTLESARRRTKPRIVDLYDVFCGVLSSGCQWRMLPADFPDWRTCYKYFRNGASSPTRSSIPFWNKS